MKVAVTGAAGRLGRHVVDALAADHSVNCLDIRVPDRAPGNWTQCDVADLDAVEVALTGQDAVVHLAALVARREDAPLRAFADVMVRGTWNVMDAAARLGLGRVVNVSSVSAGGWPPDGRFRVTTDDRFALERADLYYGLAKRLGEEIANSYAESYPGVALVNIRPAIISDVALAESEQPFPRRAGKYWFSHVDPRDVARAIAGALVTVPAPRGTYSVSAPRTDALFEYARGQRDLGYLPRFDWPDEREPAT